METPFTHQGHTGRVVVTVEAAQAPADLSAREGATGLANCKATIEFSAKGSIDLSIVI